MQPGYNCRNSHCVSCIHFTVILFCIFYVIFALFKTSNCVNAELYNESFSNYVGGACLNLAPGNLSIEEAVLAWSQCCSGWNDVGNSSCFAISNSTSVSPYDECCLPVLVDALNSCPDYCHWRVTDFALNLLISVVVFLYAIAYSIILFKAKLCAGHVPPRIITRKLILKLLERPEVTMQEMAVLKQMKTVELLLQALGLPNSQAAYEHCWTALDWFLVGVEDIDPVAQAKAQAQAKAGGTSEQQEQSTVAVAPPVSSIKFNKFLRTINFCIDLYGDYMKRNLTVQQYLQTRQQLINKENTHLIKMGRYRMQTNGFRFQNVTINLPNGSQVSVNAVVSRDPHRVFALKMNEIQTLFGRLVKAEEVIQDQQSLQPIRYNLTGRKVILKTYVKHELHNTRTPFLDPFKEIAALRFLRGATGFPTIVDVLEDDSTFIKVESDCGTSLFALAAHKPNV